MPARPAPSILSPLRPTTRLTLLGSPRPRSLPPAHSLLPSSASAFSPSSLPRRSVFQPSQQQRTFFDLPAPPPQTLIARRTLPYPPAAVYALVADIDAYSAFLPFCAASRVTRWSAPDASHQGTRWPVEADLSVGWGGFDETFTSEVRCAPGRGVVEARSQGEVFKSLVTSWTVRPSSSPVATALGGSSRTVAEKVSGEAGGSCSREAHERTSVGTDVELSIRFQFANPLYAAVSSAVSDKVAATMIEAFENQARRVLGQPRGQQRPTHRDDPRQASRHEEHRLRQHQQQGK